MSGTYFGFFCLVGVFVCVVFVCGVLFVCFTVAPHPRSHIYEFSYMHGVLFNFWKLSEFLRVVCCWLTASPLPDQPPFLTLHLNDVWEEILK